VLKKGIFMDLHDYKDVAENYDLYLDVMYKDVDNHSGFKNLLELTGYEIANVYGGYQKESSEGSAKNVIWCVRKR
jgi:hypothetical protein